MIVSSVNSTCGVCVCGVSVGGEVIVRRIVVLCRKILRLYFNVVCVCG